MKLILFHLNILFDFIYTDKNEILETKLWQTITSGNLFLTTQCWLWYIDIKEFL